MAMNVIDQSEGNGWKLYNADCIEVMQAMPDNKIHYTIYSPSFEGLYIFSNSERDFGNCASREQFWQHYLFMIRENFRITMPGRLVSVHCMSLPALKTRDGFIGIRDFRGEIIRAHIDAGFIFHSEVCIWKDPVTAMQRTHSIRLLHKQLVKDSSMSGQGLADYVVTFRKPGENEEYIPDFLQKYYGQNEELSAASERVTKESPESVRRRFSIDVWQNYASPVWDDINPSDTLQKESARDSKDEKHISPLQLQVIARCLQLWSNPGDVVFSPNAGIGSEGFQAIKMGRNHIGVELKPSYYAQAKLNLMAAEHSQETLNFGIENP